MKKNQYFGIFHQKSAFELPGIPEIAWFMDSQIKVRLTNFRWSKRNGVKLNNALLSRRIKKDVKINICNQNK